MRQLVLLRGADNGEVAGDHDQVRSEPARDQCGVEVDQVPQYRVCVLTSTGGEEAIGPAQEAGALGMVVFAFRVKITQSGITMTHMPDTQMIGQRCNILHPVLPAVRTLSFCLAVCTAPAFAQANPETGLQAGDAEAIRQAGDGLLRANRAYRTAHEAEVGELREAITSLHNELAVLTAATAAPRIETARPTAEVSATAAGHLTLMDSDESADNGSARSAPVAPARDEPMSVSGPVGATVATTQAGGAAAPASADKLAAATEAARFEGIRGRAVRVADLARRFAADPMPLRAALAAQDAGASREPSAALTAPIASQAVQRLVQIDSELEAALALAEPERHARLAALAESLRLRKPADLRDVPDGPDRRQGMTTRTEHRRPAQ